MNERELLDWWWKPIYASGASLSWENRGERHIDEGLRRGLPTPEEYLEEIAHDRESGDIPCNRIFAFHPDDREMYAPLIAAAEDDARTHGDVRVNVVEDERYAKVSEAS